MPAYISEIGYYAGMNNFIEVAVPTGTDVSGWTVAVYNNEGDVQKEYSFGTVEATVGGWDVYLFDSDTPDWTEVNDDYGVALVDDLGNTLQFVSFEGSTVTAVDGAASGESSTSIGSLGAADETLETSDRGSTYSVQSSPNPGTIVACFTQGTLILTPTGEVPVEDLKLGDLVVTRDHSDQPIRYIARSEVSGPRIPENRQPILIPCGSLGLGLPKRDLVVSGQHRMLLAWREVRKFYDAAEVLAPAKGLVPLPGVRVKRSVRHVRYIHLLLDRHEVLIAEGTPTESFYPGPTMLRDMTSSDRQALFHAVPELRSGVEAALGEPARKLLRVQETKKLARTYHKRLKDEIVKWDVDLAMERYEAERLAASDRSVA